ncbi:Biotin/lipoyl attachment [Cinnamomum micranthum f. kanehirae]|uniref:Biotin/lipoyl attachment n=1 Tax=Cinnamomum micranthum f. kanehirae TaxID=337451 RepID=A0A443NKA3_9MAGN|nr:Biotin/lipoyl attachment [Cinnamomum micranthum f. kanehirae]
MEAAATFCSFRCTTGTIPHAGSILEKPGVVPIYNTASRPLFTSGLTGGGRLIFSSVERKRLFSPYAKASETSLAVTSDAVPSGNSSQGPVEKKNLQPTTFPNGFEALVLEVCDETDVAELKLKVGDFEMHLKRNIGATTAPTPPVVSPLTPPDVPSKPMVESVSATPPPVPQKSASVATNPFTNVSLAKSSKLAALEGSGTNSYVIVSSPTVGSFRRGRTVKGKKQPPICKEGDIIKEGQVIGYLDQFGNELPVKSDVAGEVLKLLYKDGEAVGYGDPLVAVLPSFRGIE